MSTIDVGAENCRVPPAGLVGWWRGDGSANATIGGMTGIRSGDTTFSAGKVGQGFRFDGDGDGISIGNALALQLQEFSIEAWIKRSSETQSTLDPRGSGAVFGFGSGGYAFGIQNDGRLFLTELGNTAVWSQFVITDLEWHHVAVTKSSGIVVFYVDGVPGLAHQYNPTFRFNSEAMIGAIQSGSVHSAFLGQIDEVSVYNRGLSRDEISGVFTAGSAGKCLPPVVTISAGQTVFTNSVVVTLTSSDPTAVIRYTLDGRSPSIDSFPYEAPITLTNTTTIRAQAYSGGNAISEIATITVVRTGSGFECIPANGLVGWWSAEQSAFNHVTGGEGQLRNSASYTTGKLGHAFNFKAAGDGVIVDTGPSLHLQSFTIAGWIKRRDVSNVGFGGANGVVFGFGEGGFGFGFSNDGRLFLSDMGRSAISSLTAVTDTEWHHVAVTKVGNAVIFYIDGNPGIGFQYDAQFTFGSNAAIGAAGNLTASFNGLIDETRVYNRGLVAAEIRLLFSGEAYGRCVPAELTINPDQRIFTDSTQVTLASSDTNGVIRFTLDGTAPTAGSTPYSGPITITNTAIIRAQAYFGGAPISEVVFATFVRAGAGAGLECVPTNGLVGWWPGEFGPIDFATQNYGQLVNGATIDSGKSGQAFSFNQSGAAVIVNPQSLLLQTFTISTWIKRRDPLAASLNAADGVVFGFGVGGYGFGLSNDGRLFLSLLGRNAVKSTTTVIDLEWHHVAVTRVGNTVTFFVDGSPGTTVQYDAEFSFGSNAAIGSAGNLTATFNGWVDETRIYNRGLADAELKALFNAEEYNRCIPADLTISPVHARFTNSTLVTLVSSDTNSVIRYTLDGTAPKPSSKEYEGPLTITNTSVVRAQVYAGAVPISASVRAILIDAESAAGLECVSTEGLAGWWRADNSAVDFITGDDSQLFNAVTYVPGKIAQGFRFDQAGAAILIGNPRSLQLQTFTIAAWVKRSDPAKATFSGENGVVFGFGEGGYGFGMGNDGRLFLSRLGRNSVSATRFVSDTDWHHVAVTKVENAVTFFIDGVPGNAFHYDAEFEFGTMAAIGAAGNLSATFHGSIDELRIYNRGLNAAELRGLFFAEGYHRCTPAEIKINPDGGSFTNSVELTFVTTHADGAAVRYTLDGTLPSPGSPEYTNSLTLTNSAFVRAQVFDGPTAISPMAEALFVRYGCSPVGSGLVGWWPGNMDSNDLIGRNNGVLQGDVRYTEGFAGNAFLFDGQADGVVITNAPTYQLQTFTIETWVRRTRLDTATASGPGPGVLFGYGSSGYAFGIGNDGRLILTKVGESFVASRSAITDTNWHHVALVRTPQTAAFYLDGILDAQLNYGAQFQFRSDIGIGALADLSSSFLGAIEEMSFYNRELDRQEILMLLTSLGKCDEFAPQIILQPKSQFVATGSNAVMQVSAAGTPPLAFQWQFNGNAIEGATNSVLVVTNVTQNAAGTYHVSVSNQIGLVLSDPATLTIVVPPRITRAPESQTVLVGSTAQFSVNATGGAPLSYQWFVDGRAIVGATSPVLIVNNVRFPTVTYTVRVSNPAGTVLSDPAVLRVGSAKLIMTTDGARVQLGVSGESGVNYTIEVSADLVTWSQLATILNVGPTWEFQDPTPLDTSHRFYRLRKN